MKKVDEINISSTFPAGEYYLNASSFGAIPTLMESTTFPSERYLTI